MIRKFLMLLSLMICIATGCTNTDSVTIEDTNSSYIDNLYAAKDASVLIRVIDNNGALYYGSGVIVRNKYGAYIWSAAHVFDGDPEYITAIKTEVDIENKSQKYYYAAASIIALDKKTDIALLRLDQDFPFPGISFYRDQVKQFTPVYHVGNFRGMEGIDSVSEGILSRYFLIKKDVVYMNATFTCVNGSSGGGVFLEDGRCIGIVTGKTLIDNVAVVIPYIEIRDFAKSKNLLYAIE